MNMSNPLVQAMLQDARKAEIKSLCAESKMERLRYLKQALAIRHKVRNMVTGGIEYAVRSF